MNDNTKLGPYTVRIGIRCDNPAFPTYLIFKGDALIGKPFSAPSLSDCEGIERRNSERAKVYELKIEYKKRPYTIGRRGRPTNAERERREAALLTEIPE